MLKKTIKLVAKLVKYIKEDFYNSERIIKTMVVFPSYSDIVCLRCGKNSHVELCKQCDY
jgi:hypothetical protein